MEPQTKMQYVKLGKTGLRISRFILGCMSYGSSQWQAWVKDRDESIELIGKAYELGINCFDTADAYSNGESERVLGLAIKKHKMTRSRIVVCTKFTFAVSDDMSINTLGQSFESPDFINQCGGSRKHIFDAIDGSLKRLDLDYIDLLQVHRLDKETPLEETMEALNDLVRSGKVRYIGASSMYAWQFQKANAIAEKKGWTTFVSMQNLYNLIYREEEREMFPYCLDAGIGCIPWSPLARGLLTGKNRITVRLESDMAIHHFFAKKEDANNEEILDRVVSVAERLGHTPAQVALAWMLAQPHVTAPIVGITRESNLYDIIGSLDVKLSQEDIRYLEEPYIPRNLIPM